ncbi:MAG: methyltransferase [Rhodospirillaceae bacterium]
MSESILPAGITEDSFLGGQLRLRQPASGYRAAIDPVFLAASVPAQPGERVLEAGTGHGAAAICLGWRVPGCRISGIEKQPDLVRLANDNARLNGLSGCVDVMIGDLARPLPRLSDGGFDHVMANPPFLGASRADAPAQSGRAAAHVEDGAALKDWIGFMLKMVRPKGTVTLIHRADRLDEILALLWDRAGEVVVFPLWPKRGTAAKRVIVGARKGIRTPLTLSAGLVLHEDSGAYTPDADAVLRGAALTLR